MTSIKTIAALAADSFQTPAAVVNATDPPSTLESTGPAPFFSTKVVFAAIQKVVDSLLGPENKAKFINIHACHVVSNTHITADFNNSNEFTTLQDEK